VKKTKYNLRILREAKPGAVKPQPFKTGVAMTKVHGVFSLFLLSLSQALAMTAMFLESVYLGLGYAIFLMATSLTIVYTYCTKCPVRTTSCGHVFVGKITQIFPERKEGPYSQFEYTIVVIALLSLIMIPQYWLWNNRGLLIAFWILVILAGAEINRFVCPQCDNSQCIACKKQKAIKKN